MSLKVLQIKEVSVEELVDMISDRVYLKIEKRISEKPSKKEDVLLTRNDVSKYLKVSLTTIHHWTKGGVLKAYRIGNRVYYKKNELGV